MVVAGDFKNGVTFEMDGNVLQVLEFQHVKPGKGAAFVRTKLRNVITGALLKRLSIPLTNLKMPMLKERICNIFTATAIYIILWIWKPMSSFQSVRTSYRTTLNS